MSPKRVWVVPDQVPARSQTSSRWVSGKSHAGLGQVLGGSWASFGQVLGESQLGPGWVW